METQGSPGKCQPQESVKILEGFETVTRFGMILRQFYVSLLGQRGSQWMDIWIKQKNPIGLQAQISSILPPFCKRISSSTCLVLILFISKKRLKQCDMPEKRRNLGGKQNWFLNIDSNLTSCVALSQLLNLSEPRSTFSSVNWGINTELVGLLGLKDMNYTKIIKIIP